MIFYRGASVRFFGQRPSCLTVRDGGCRELNGQLKLDFPQDSGVEVMHEEERLLSGQYSTQKSHFILSRLLRAFEPSQGSEWDFVTVCHFSEGL